MRWRYWRELNCGAGWISCLITRGGPQPLERLLSPVDYEHYISRQLKPVADAILPFVGGDFERLLDGQYRLF